MILDLANKKMSFRCFFCNSMPTDQFYAYKYSTKHFLKLLLPISWVSLLYYVIRFTDPKDERPVKIIRIKYQSSPIETSKVTPHMYKQKGRRSVFDDDLVRQPSNEVSKLPMVAGHGGGNLG